jgi:dihydroceramide fatty acyl 2-hydroxylase
MSHPSYKRVPRAETPRMFESDLMERLSHVHPATPALLYLPVVLVSLYAARHVGAVGPGRLALEFVGGYLLWTLFEYWAHRLLFHMPVVGRKTARIQFLIHGVHHECPTDETRLVFPASASLLLCVLTYAAFHAALGPLGMYGPFAGFVCGYVLYDTLHWYVHARVPTNRFARWLRREHFLHHFKYPGSRFGVSCPWLDYVFGTRSSEASMRSARSSTSAAGEVSASGLSVKES